MRIDIITVLPEMIEGFVHESILARAEKKGLAEIRLHNLRDYTLDKWRRVDDYPYGGSAGMVMQCEPIDRCITALKAERDYDEVIFTSPDGECFDQHIANDYALRKRSRKLPHGSTFPLSSKLRTARPIAHAWIRSPASAMRKP